MSDVTTREVLVPREIVFELFTTAEHLQCWFSPGPVPDEFTALDAPLEVSFQGAGGNVRVTFTDLYGSTQIEIHDESSDPAWPDRLDSLIEYLSSI